MTSSSGKGRDAFASYVVQVALLAVLYFGAAKLGLTMAFVTEQVTAVWPPTGIALAALVIFGRRLWPAVTLGAFLANATANEPLGAAAGIAVGNTLEALLGAWLLRLVGFDPALGRVKDVLALVVLAAGASTTVSATIGAASLCAGGVQPWAASPAIWGVWWLGDAMGNLVVAPLLFAWAGRHCLRWLSWRVAEAAALLLALAVVSLSVFAASPAASVHPLAYAVFPFLIWAALRFGQPATTLMTFAASSLAIWGTLHGSGPFAASTPQESLILLQIYMGVVAVTTLFLTAVTTEREMAKEAARQSRDELTLTLEATRVGTWNWDQRTGKVLWSDNLEVIHGLAPGTFGGTFEAFLEGVHPEDRDGVLRAIRTALEQVTDYEIEYRCLCQDGSLRWVAGRGQATHDAAGRPLGMRGICSDVTPRKQAEEALQQSYELLRAVIEGTTDAIFVKDRQGRYLMINTAGAGFLGKAVAEVIGKDDTELFSPQTARAIMEGDRRIMATGEIQTYEDVGTAAGVTRTYLSTKGPLRDARGDVVGVIGISRDVTERKRAEERFRLVVESAPCGMVVINREGRIDLVNAQAEKMFGYGRGELLGQPVELLVPDRFRGEHPAYRVGFLDSPIARAMAGGREVYGRRHDGSEFPVEIGLTPIEMAEGPFVLSAILDVTARKRSERWWAAAHAVTCALASSASLEEAAAPVLRTVGETLRCDLGVLWQLDAGGSLRCAHVWRAPGIEPSEFERFSRQITFARGEGLPGRAWDTGKPAWISEAPFPRSVAAQRKGPHAALAFPLLSEGQVLGVLEFFSPDLRQPDENLFAMVAGLGNQIAEFIGRRHAEMTVRVRAREFSLAGTIQQGLLPKSPPQLTGLDVAGACHPAQETGGDYFDFIPLAEGHWGIALGDASGHGVGPALLIAETRAYLRAFALTNTEPGQVLDRVNQRLVDDMSADYFVTLFLARLDPDACSLVYSNAGHQPGYVLGGDGEVKMALPSTGPPLGVSPAADFPKGPPVCLDPGDLVLLLSDGIAEARSDDRRQFGIGRALEVVRAHRHEPSGAVIAALLEEVRAWSHSRQTDDMTAVVIKRR